MVAAVFRGVMAVTLVLVAVLLARRPLRALSGAGPAYALWLLVPLSALAASLPTGWIGAPMPMTSIATSGWVVTALAPVQARMVTGAGPGIHVLVWLWLAGAAVRLAVGLERARRVRRSMRRPSPRQSDEWCRRLRTLQPRGRLPRPAFHAYGPALFGTLRPWLLLPPDFDARFPGARGELVLRHELAHHRRGDGLWNALAEAVATLLWWHPLVWIALPRYRLDQELACDAAVLAEHAGQRVDYGRALLDTQAGGRLFAASHWLGISSLKERIHMIQQTEISMMRRRVGALLVGMAVAAVAVAAPHAPAMGGGDHAPGHPAQAATVPARPLAHRLSTKPVYPADAAKAGQAGTVVVKVQVGADGRAHQVRLMGDTPVYPALAQSAIDYARQMRFDPAMKAGKPVSSWVQMPVTYSLDEQPSAAK